MTDAVAITLITTIGTAVSTIITTCVVVFSKKSTQRRIKDVHNEVTEIRKAQQNGAGDPSKLPALSNMRTQPPAWTPARKGD